jgi:hypothetical protein
MANNIVIPCLDELFTNRKYILRILIFFPKNIKKVYHFLKDILEMFKPHLNLVIGTLSGVHL